MQRFRQAKVGLFVSPKNKPGITANVTIFVIRLFHFHVRDKLFNLVRYDFSLAGTSSRFRLRTRHGDVSLFPSHESDRVNLIPATARAIDPYPFKSELELGRNLAVDVNPTGLGPDALATVQYHVR